MKNQTALIAAAMLAGSGILALAAPASAASAPKPLLRVIHGPSAAALPHVQSGPRSGIVPSRASKQNSTRAAASASLCTEPNCDLSYGGGPVQHSPHVYLLLWGPGWSSTGTTPAYNYLTDFYKGLGVSGGTWSTVTSQYGDSTGKPSFAGTAYAGAWQDTTAPPADVTPSALAAEAHWFATSQNIADLADAQIVIASQSGTCFSDGFAGNCGTMQTAASDYCGWHDYTGTVSYTNLPYQPDAGSECGQNFVNSGSAGQFDGYSIVGGHEYAESITDPHPPSGWIDLADTVSGGEIGDKCAWAGQPFGVTDPAGDVTLGTGKFAMQSLWSNSAGTCVISQPMAPPPPAPKDSVSLKVVSRSGTRITWQITVKYLAGTTPATVTFFGYKGSSPTKLATYVLKAGTYSTYKTYGYTGLGAQYSPPAGGWVHVNT